MITAIISLFAVMPAWTALILRFPPLGQVSLICDASDMKRWRLLELKIYCRRVTLSFGFDVAHGRLPYNQNGFSEDSGG